tara:strand:- start:26 stop:226 length:201 start_codon:yes stop_codon:yes gene_type:complete
MSGIFNDFMKLDLKSIDINTQVVYKELKKDKRQGKIKSDEEFQKKLTNETLMLMRAKLIIKQKINK